MVSTLSSLGLILSVGLGAFASTAQGHQSCSVHAGQVGLASWYGDREAGNRTASGSIFDPALKTAAHRRLPLGSCVQVTHLGNGRSLIVPITDRGPYSAGRLIDLSQAAARDLGMERAGLARVRVVVAACVQEPPITTNFLLPPQKERTIDSTRTPPSRNQPHRVRRGYCLGLQSGG
jgi:rare lipoprotein A (peptidoglycan hydrolase)